MAAAERETLAFQTEARQLLQLMIHSLYSNREIFLRELISNASDAVDKRRFAALEQPELAADGEVRIDFDADAKTLTISDNGIGMSRDEVVSNLGTIARSGTAEFLSNLSGDAQQDSQLIGQFGVGFYSSFIVADRVEVVTRRAGEESATRWESAGEADFSVAEDTREEAGTDIILHLKDDAEEFLDEYRLRNVIRTYSDHIAVPVKLRKPAPPPAADEDGEEDETVVETAPEFEAVNEAKALWTRSRSDVSDDEYKAFYQHISHDFEEPASWSHNKVEGKLEYTSLLFLPKRAPFDLWQREGSRGLKLYVQRVFIMDEAEQFLPMYLRFMKGVVDCADLPLNVSREILQQDGRVDSIRSALIKRTLDMLARLAREDEEAYQSFWETFGEVLKEGPTEDFANRENIAKLLRFATTVGDDATANQSLAGYVERMGDAQKSIYYLCADSWQAARSSPHIEGLRKAGVEVLLLSDRIDEWLMSSLNEFDGHPLRDAARGDIEEGLLEDASDDAEDQDDDSTDSSALTVRMGGVLGDTVKEVRRSRRLTDSPVCLVVDENDMGAQMRRVLQSAGQEVPETARILEINTGHPLIQRLDAEADEDRFAELTHVLHDQALLAEGGQLQDPGTYVQRLNRLLLELSGGGAA